MVIFKCDCNSEVSGKESRAEAGSKTGDGLEWYAGDGVGNESNGSCKMGNRRIGHRRRL